MAKAETPNPGANLIDQLSDLLNERDQRRKDLAPVERFIAPELTDAAHPLKGPATCIWVMNEIKIGCVKFSHADGRVIHVDLWKGPNYVEAGFSSEYVDGLAKRGMTRVFEPGAKVEIDSDMRRAVADRIALVGEAQADLLPAFAELVDGAARAYAKKKHDLWLRAKAKRASEDASIAPAKTEFIVGN